MIERVTGEIPGKVRLARKYDRLVARLALVVAVTAGSLGGCELAVRWVMPQPPSWLSIYTRRDRPPLYAFQPGAQQLVETGETRWHVVTDLSGDRIPIAPQESSERISPTTQTVRPIGLGIGDSYLFGHGVEQEETFIGRLNAAHVGGLQFVNAGVPGYGPTQYRQLLEDRCQHGWRPQHVLIATYLGNDFFDCVWNKDLPVVDGVPRWKANRARLD